MQRLRAASRLQRLAEAEQLQAIADLAEHHEWTADDEFDVVGERPVRLGADGTRLVGEFLPLEVAAVLGMSVTAASWLVRDVLDLQARHPVLWESVQSLQVRAYQAFQVTRLTAEYALTCDQAQALDARLRPKFGRIAWPRLMRLARGLLAWVAGDQVAQAATAGRSTRFVRMGPSGHALVTDVHAQIDTADAHQLEASIAAIATTLRRLGDIDALEVRRSKALGILATPARAQALLAGRDDARYLPRTKVFLHLAADTVSETAGVARSERLGPVMRAQLAELFGTHRITVLPVLDARTQTAVDAYEVPDAMREVVVQRDGCEVFPYSSRAARRLDLDHTEPFVAGATGQTRPDNLGPLTRRVHRSKTARRWTVVQPRKGVFWWTSPTGQQYRVGPDGTDDVNGWSSLERRLYRALDDLPPPGG